MKRKVAQTDEQHELVLPVPRRNDATLVAGIRSGDNSALREFCERFRPLLLDQARRIGVHRDDREHTVMDFLDDFALRIAMGELSYTAPSFVVKAFRNRVVDVWRKEQQERQTNGTDEALHAVSEYTRRAATNPTMYGESRHTHHSADSTETDDGRRGCLRAVEVMMQQLLSQCDDDERSLVVWASHGVPLRVVAEWLGISHAAVRVRWSRLKARMRTEAEAYVQTITGRERAEVERFLRYAEAQQREPEEVFGSVVGRLERGEKHA